MRRAAFLLLLALTGCPGFGNEDPVVPAQVTYNDNIKAILDAHCIKCHVVPPKNGAPTGFRLDQYADDNAGNQGAMNKAPLIKSNTDIDFMPLAPNPHLTQLEKDTIARWIDQGTRESL